jgi:hypothetical protein
MSRIIGSGYIGSPSLQTSTANQEIIPTKPAGWTHGYNLYKFSFMNDQDCVVVINNLAPIFLRAGQGMNVDNMDSPVWSFKITTSGITFNFVGAY